MATARPTARAHAAAAVHPKTDQLGTKPSVGSVAPRSGHGHGSLGPFETRSVLDQSRSTQQDQLGALPRGRDAEDARQVLAGQRPGFSGVVLRAREGAAVHAVQTDAGDERLGDEQVCKDDAAIKDALEAACPGVVSCADIIAFAARDASYFLSGGKVYFDMPAGRLDGTFSNASEPLKFLVPPTSNLSDLISSFVVKGMSVEDLVVLSGAHTVGRSHCSSFVSDRLAVPSDINGGFAGFLRSRCPTNPTDNDDPTVMQDVVTPNELDNQYYKNVLSHTVLFTSDAALLTSPKTAKMVVDNAKMPGWWEDRFKTAMVKMASIEVKTGYQGQIRKNCRAINHY